MKIRNIAYGYHYVNGIILPHPQESQIVKDIFIAYLQGKSLRQLTNWLNEQKIEYMAGVITWNKAKIMRILEDPRYLGDDKYPAIIEHDLYDNALKIKDKKNVQKNIDRHSAIFQLNVPIRCPFCNSPMRRRVDNRQTMIKWDCQNHKCKTIICTTDEQLLFKIKNTLNLLISNPHIIDIPAETKSPPSLEQMRLHNEIAKLFDCAQVDRDQVKTKLLEYASLKYQELDSAVCATQRLKDTFLEASPLTTFCLLLFEKTVDEIKLYTDGNIGIILTNKQEIKSEGGQYGST